MFPSECVLDRSVRSGRDWFLADTNLPLFILECKDRKAEGYADDKLEIYNKRLQGMVIGVRLADAPPAVSYLAILRSDPAAEIEIVTVDKTVIVISLDFPGEARSYLIYDAVALSLRMIPVPENFSLLYPLTFSVSFARPCLGPDYALVHTCRLDASGDGDYLLLWRSSSSSPPWSEYKKARLPDRIDWSVNDTDTMFSFNGHVYWVDLLRGVSYCRCDAIFDDSRSVVKFGGCIPLPVPRGGHDTRIAEPAAYRTMGAVRDSIRFVSINGFQDYVRLEDRTVTVWKLLGHYKGWEIEHQLSLQTLWGFKGFGDLPKDLTPMYPLLSMEDPDVVYLVLGEYSEDHFEGFEKEFYPSDPRYLLAVDMRNKIVRTFDPQDDEEDWFDNLISCGFRRYLRKALLGPCDVEGIPMKKSPTPMKKPRMKKCRRTGGNAAVAFIPMKKKRRRDGGNAAEAPIHMRKKPRLEKLMCC